MGKLCLVGYSLEDVNIIPAVSTSIDHRCEPNPFTEICGRESYPIFVAPMGAVTDENNYGKWIENKLTPVIPRSVGTRLSVANRLKLAETTFVSLSLSEFKAFSETEYEDYENTKYICVDLANGHMETLIDTCKYVKEKLKDKIVIMTGNIANPETYRLYCDAKIDYVRVGIGGGSRCTTSANVGVHYPMATLLDKINDVRMGISGFKTKVVADGGIYNFDDINKCLAIGADAVMIGRVFAECEEACGEVLYSISEEAFNNGIGYTKEQIGNIDAPIKSGFKPYRAYYGMSTKQAQKETGGNGDKTAEGISRPVVVRYPVAKWVDNMQSNLRSGMSYLNANTLKDMWNSEFIILGCSGDHSYRK